MSEPKVVGRYRIYEEIAAGGMATVSLGRMIGAAGFARTVAIKQLHAFFAKDEEFVSMFVDEARLAARISHPNVVATLDVVQEPDGLYLVMDYVHGDTLSKLLRTASKTGMPLPPRVTAGIVIGALHGLHAAHEAQDEAGGHLGIVHRDVSPQNILVGADGVARVLDFGIAKAVGRSHATRGGQVKGKVAYMAPEQLRGGAVARQADVYAASVVLWEALVGKRLFRGDTHSEIVGEVLAGRIPLPSSVNPALDAFDAVVMRGLSASPAERFETARQMAVALERAAGSAPQYEISELVETLLGEALAKRAAQVKRVESAPTPSAPDRGEEPTTPDARVPAHDGSGETTGTSFANRATHEREASSVERSAARRRGRWRAAILVALVAAPTLAAATYWLPRGATTPGTAPERAKPEDSSTGAAAVPPSSAAPPPSLTVPSSPPASASTPPRQQPPRAPPRPGCAQPFLIDSRGVKHPRPECL